MNIFYTVEEECCRAGALFALERPTEPLECRSDPALTCDSRRDDFCCECCNFGTLSYAAAKEVGCEVNRGGIFGDCRVVFEECCYGRGNLCIDKYAVPIRDKVLVLVTVSVMYILACICYNHHTEMIILH